MEKPREREKAVREFLSKNYLHGTGKGEPDKINLKRGINVFTLEKFDFRKFLDPSWRWARKLTKKKAGQQPEKLLEAASEWALKGIDRSERPSPTVLVIDKEKLFKKSHAGITGTEVGYHGFLVKTRDNSEIPIDGKTVRSVSLTHEEFKKLWDKRVTPKELERFPGQDGSQSLKENLVRRNRIKKVLFERLVEMAEKDYAE